MTLGTSLDACIAEARAAHPDVTLADSVVRAHFQGFVERGAALESIRADQLMLACGCAHRDPRALARFEESYFREIDAVVRRFPNLPLTLDDVRQRMREKFFLKTPPAIASYSGQGTLAGWVRASALREVLNIVARESREQPTEEKFFDAVLDGDATAEAAVLKESCRAEFEAAFTAAVETLNPREKSLLRYSFVDNASIDQIGLVFRVHRATAARWVGAARAKLVAATHAELCKRLRVGEDEVASIVRAAMSGVGSALLRRLA